MWHYRTGVRNYPGWHFTADHLGVTFLISLFTKMLESQWPARFHLKISRPTPRILQIPNNQDGQAKIAIGSDLVIHHPKDRVDQSFWEITSDTESITITVGTKKLKELLKGIRNIELDKLVCSFDLMPERQGADDDQGLHIWWCIN